jgi:predicted amidohydrolase
MDLKLNIAQTNPVLGDLHKYLEQHLEVATAAANAGADPVHFPEHGRR